MHTIHYTKVDISHLRVYSLYTWKRHQITTYTHVYACMRVVKYTIPPMYIIHNDGLQLIKALQTVFITSLHPLSPLFYLPLPLSLLISPLFLIQYICNYLSQSPSPSLSLWPPTFVILLHYIAHLHIDLGDPCISCRQ